MQKVRTHAFALPEAGISVNTKLIDEGPAKWTKHVGDLTEAAAKLFDKHAPQIILSEHLVFASLEEQRTK